MSLMKRYVEDSDLVRELAREAAQLLRATDRMRALDGAFTACGEAAGKYADPEAVLKRLVREAVFEYGAVRSQHRNAERTPEPVL
ncbi:hypothetical protein GCM10010218_19940 [Streptomyces mashuensis]|uniref:Uncharacterized protein n=1 Tax=Streptomyces mashuensis TaxID=33904 RepID=A0A919B1F2_9ACTN|nr:hypothetical protein [Streptomyces mashuensis]GHF38730.1 hypothetical protein GCM10010218_19940 [Streptomyces mashuensis]